MEMGGMSDLYEIATLADDYHTKRQYRDALAIMNTPADPQKAREASIAFHVADAECVQAWQRLEAAKLRP
jgi:hypothetical protein